MDEQNVYEFNEILLNLKKEGNSDSYNNMDKHEYIMLNVLGTKTNIVSFHLWYNYKSPIHRDRKYSDGFKGDEEKEGWEVIIFNEYRVQVL